MGYAETLGVCPNARAQRFHAYVERLTTALGHRDRHGPLRDYVTGLCLPGDRKSIEPMAARVVRAAREPVWGAWDRRGPGGGGVVDDTGMPKKGHPSAGAARQYCGV